MESEEPRGVYRLMSDWLSRMLFAPLRSHSARKHFSVDRTGQPPNGRKPFLYRITEGLPVNRPQPQPIRCLIENHQAGKRGVTGNVDTTLRFELISFFKGDLCGQTDTAKHDLEARIRTQAIKQQVRLEGQGKV
jgi:hypothetical protein